jgi:hypothetical protein
MLALFLFGLYLVIVSVLLRSDRLSWWIKVDTQTPTCTYYFGPFDSYLEATHHQGDYLDDLYLEGATHIQVSIERSCPKVLTICPEDSSFSPT